MVILLAGPKFSADLALFFRLAFGLKNSQQNYVLASKAGRQADRWTAITSLVVPILVA